MEIGNLAWSLKEYLQEIIQKSPLETGKSFTISLTQHGLTEELKLSVTAEVDQGDMIHFSLQGRNVIRHSTQEDGSIRPALIIHFHGNSSESVSLKT